MIKVSRLPMRNWNLWRCEYKWGQFRVSRLPMRNWNISKGKCSFVIIEGFQTTYEELKPFQANGSGYLHSRVSRLPMRNWNSAKWIIKDLCQNGFQTTYEELKHNISSFPGNLELRFQTTYEELKLYVPIPEIFFLFRFQTTYEELKPLILTTQETSSFTVSRLPMRNWNMKII